MDKMQTVPIDSVIPYEFNNRNHSEIQVNRIANSIKEFGFNLELGFLEDHDFDLKEWGLDELQELFDPEEAAAEEDDPVDCENDETFIQLGDVIQLNQHWLYCADAQKFRDFDKNVFDLLLTDPPYGVAYVGKTEDELTLENDDLDADEIRALWDDTLSAIWHSLKDGASIYATVPAGPLKQVFAECLAQRGALRQELVWLKDSMVLGRSDYHYKHEPILYGWKSGAAHYFTNDRTKTSILEFARPKASTEHPTMKPVALWAELIVNSTKKGAKVLDPFMGSGTTIIACDQTGRKATGIEIDPKYCHVIIERFKKHCDKTKQEFNCTVNGNTFSPSEV